jgi:alkylation response protein AidB-like acyl-CoA dehydrogenase
VAAPILELPGSEDPVRTQVRHWLAGHPVPSARELAEAGLVAPHWPAPFGRGADAVTQLVIDDELRRAGVSRPLNPIGLGWAGPTILFAGTEAQQQRWLWPMLAGEELWCQLFSEPDAGSDLAALRTTAVRDGDEWVVQGQKVWTSLAHVAAFGILLARTDPDAPKHRGISYFVCPMHAPGVTVRPLVDMTGAHAFNEVFLDGVRLPADHLVGDEGDGWTLARVTLGNERVSLSGDGALWGRGPTAAGLVALVRSAAGSPLSPTLRDRLVRAWAEGEVLQALRLRTVGASMSGREPGPSSSIRKALADDHGQDVMNLARDMSGTFGTLSPGHHSAAERSGEPAAAVDGSLPEGPPWADREWATGFLYSRALTIGGGTAEVQRNIIAERLLGLPRDAVAGDADQEARRPRR